MWVPDLSKCDPKIQKNPMCKIQMILKFFQTGKLGAGCLIQVFSLIENPTLSATCTQNTNP
jgi:hypothetical protein